MALKRPSIKKQKTSTDLARMRLKRLHTVLAVMFATIRTFQSLGEDDIIGAHFYESSYGGKSSQSGSVLLLKQAPAAIWVSFILSLFCWCARCARNVGSACSLTRCAFHLPFRDVFQPDIVPFCVSSVASSHPASFQPTIAPTTRPEASPSQERGRPSSMRKALCLLLP